MAGIRTTIGQQRAHEQRAVAQDAEQLPAADPQPDGQHRRLATKKFSNGKGRISTPSSAEKAQTVG